MSQIAVKRKEKTFVRGGCDMCRGEENCITTDYNGRKSKKKEKI